MSSSRLQHRQKRWLRLSASCSKPSNSTSSRCTERRRTEKAGPGPGGQLLSMASLGGLVPPDDDNGTTYLVDERWSALRDIGTASGWLVDPAEVTIGAELGQGSFGTTFRGSWRGGDLAVKRVRISKPEEATSFLREVSSLACLRHPNIMPFIGACLMPPQHCYLLCEYLPGGTLTNWLHGNRRQGGRGAPKRALADKIRMALGVARGMQALEEAQPPILHRDLKASNVFLDAGGHPRVADMGLSRRWEPESAASLTGETGTYHYMAPEVIRHEMYDSRADVYSWGVLFAEILQQQFPYEGLYCTPVQCAMAVGDDKLRPTIPSDTPQALVAVAGACFEPEPAMRPSFGVIVHRLSTFLSSLRSSPGGSGGGSSADSTASIKRMFGWGGAGANAGDTTPSPTKRSPGTAAVNGHS
ncbi:hypothetical protein WJX73_007224 [Symbiochloris irregularis]|uniref:Protein kinase domain-containing protein n=1 Tax=Symbiochloris irregularis TaxID=706552 RepID=A0AAW1NVX5_9CHLO